ncbi:MAG: NAD-dependent epimerase/dehydratase family protein [Candidatus Peribacteraceae bacterium]
MHILVTGSSGTIGTRLCERLLELEHDVVGIDLRPNVWITTIDQRTHIGDLRLPATLPNLELKNIDLIIHLAANARVYDLVQDPTQALDNEITLFNTLEWARKNKVRQFIFASSRECYGNIDTSEYTEDLVRIEHCESPYTASKIAGEVMVHAYRRCYEMTTAIVRFSNVFGAYDFKDRAVPLFIQRAKKGDPLVVFGKDKCLDFTFIDDAVNGLILCMEQLEKVSGETFNIAFGEGITIQHLAEEVISLLHSNSSIEIQPSRTGEVTHYIANIQKAKTFLKYSPKVPFSEGIRFAVEWYRTHSASAKQT